MPEIRSNNNPVIAIHGGAGNIKKQKLTPEEEQAYTHILDSAITVGYSALQQGVPSEEVAALVVTILEDNPLFNAGRGAVFNHEGENELDAAIMRGSDMACGAVSGVKRIKNPILLAKEVMNHSEHVFLSGQGAEDFAASRGIAWIDPAWFYTQKRRDQLNDALEKEKAELDHDGKSASIPDANSDYKFGTVGCVVMDKGGHLAAATSTGGLTNKRYGRIGDTPVIGAGTYASDSSCAVSCTGKGEDFIRFTAASSIANRIQYLNEPLDSAVHHVLHKVIAAHDGRGGCIAIDRTGKVVADFTTSGMFRALIDAEGKKTIAIY